MNPYISKKISILSFVAMVTVVAIHSHTLQGDAAPAFKFVQTLLMRSLSDWAVPFFFVVSGYFFGTSILGGRFKYIPFLKKKVKGLLTPYLIWGLIGGLVILPLIMFNNHVGHHPIFDRTFMAPDAWYQKLNVLFGLFCFGPRGNLALWYVRTLMVFFILAPMWATLLKWHWSIPMLAGALACVLGFETKIPYLSVEYSSWGWILVGMGCAGAGLLERKGNVLFFGIVALGYLVLSCMNALDFQVAAIKPFVPFFGIAFWWLVYDYLPVFKKMELPWFMRMTFWVYCMHTMVCGYVMAGLYFILGKSDIVCLAISFTCIVVGVGVCLLCGRLLQRWMPKVYGIMSGGR